MEETEIVAAVKDKFVWKWKYTLVLVMNLLYGILFYLLMQNYQ